MQNFCGRLAGLLFCLCLSSCEYDQDFSFVPETKAVFFLVEVEERQHLRKVDVKGSILPNWGDLLGLVDPTDIAGNAKDLWVGVSIVPSLVRIDLQSERQAETHNLGQFQPHFLSMGSRYLMMSDTSQNQIGFFHLKKKETTVLQLENKPGKAVYRSSKFYVIEGEQSVSIYSEDALAPIKKLNFSRPVFDLVLDNRFTTFVYTQDSLIYRAEISWNSNSLIAEEEQVPESKMRFTPYIRANFGKEYTGIVSLQEGRLSNFPEPLADDFEVDFLEANIYFSYRDSLKIMNLPAREIRNLGPFSGKFKSAVFYSPVGEIE